MMKLTIASVFIAFFMITVSTAQDRTMCITIDDLPVVDYAVEELGHEQVIVGGLLAAFTQYQVPAMGYVNADKLFRDGEVDSSRVKLLEMWLSAGHELGNHTYAHSNYHKVSQEAFQQDVLDGERVVKDLVEQYGGAYKYFRHPYLRSGQDSLHSAALKAFLEAQGYQEAPVTVDNDDYLFALAYARAYRQKDQSLMSRIGDSYVDYMVEKVIFYERNAQELVGRPIQQTLLIHASLINAVYLDDLLGRLAARGYQFISQEEVLTDPVYNMPVTRFGDWGISWLHRWAMSQGVSKDFYKGEPDIPDFVRERSR